MGSPKTQGGQYVIHDYSLLTVKVSPSIETKVAVMGKMLHDILWIKQTSLSLPLSAQSSELIAMTRKR